MSHYKSHSQLTQVLQNFQGGKHLFYFYECGGVRRKDGLVTEYLEMGVKFLALSQVS